MKLNVRIGETGPWLVDVLLLASFVVMAVVGALLVEPAWLTAVIVGISVVGTWVALYAMARL